MMRTLGFTVYLQKSLTCRTGIAGRIGHLFQVPLQRRRYASGVVKRLARNPPEIYFAETQRSGVKLRVVHGRRQRQIVLALPLKPFRHVRLDAMGVTALG